MWSVVLLFLGLMKAASYVAGSGTTVDEKSGTSVLRTSSYFPPVVAFERAQRQDHDRALLLALHTRCISSSIVTSSFVSRNELDPLRGFRIHDGGCEI